MEIRSSHLSLLTQTAATSASRQPLPALQAGQRLEAWVLNRQSPSQVLLEVLGRRVLADTRLPLRAGDHLKLEVVANLGTLPQLKIIAHTPQSSQVAAQALRTILPKEEPLTQTFSSLKETVNQPRLRNQLPPAVVEKLSTLLDTLPRRAELVQADSLKKVLRRSGLLAETTQMAISSAADTKSTGMDLKTQLVQLVNYLRSRAPEPTATRQTEPVPADRTGPNPPPAAPRLPDSEGRLNLPSQASRPPLIPRPSVPANPPPTVSNPPLPGNRSESPTAGPEPATRAPSPPALRTEGSHTKPQPHPSQGPGETTPTKLPRTPAPPMENTLELIGEKVSAAIARITLDQLASLPKADNPVLTWHFELPVLQEEAFDPLRLTIQGDPRQTRDEPEERPWSVVIEMEPANLGKIRIRLVLQEKRISAYFWSESEQTRGLFERHMQSLAGNLLSQGLEPEHLQTVRDAPPVPPSLRPDVPLVDENI